MPIYEYACTACGRRVEVIHGIHEPGPSNCDVCGGPMTKLLSPPAIVFRGTGWAKKERASSGPADSDGRSEEKPGAQPRDAGATGRAQGPGGAGEPERSAGGSGDGGGTTGTSRSGGRAGSSGSRDRAGSGGSDGGGSSSER
jgi:putative FmdB family regulatory protein